MLFAKPETSNKIISFHQTECNAIVMYNYMKIIRPFFTYFFEENAFLKELLL